MPESFEYQWARNDDEKKRELVSHLINNHDWPASMVVYYLYEAEEIHARTHAAGDS